MSSQFTNLRQAWDAATTAAREAESALAAAVRDASPIKMGDKVIIRRTGRFEGKEAGVLRVEPRLIEGRDPEVAKCNVTVTLYKADGGPGRQITYTADELQLLS